MAKKADDVIVLTELIQAGGKSDTTAPHAVDPNEQLQMPGLDSIDNLLTSLDMTSTPAMTPATPATEDQSQQASDLDLDSLLGFSPKAEAAPAAPQPQDTGDAFNLDALIGENVHKLGGADTGDIDADLSAILAMEDPVDSTGTNAASLAQDFKDDDLEALFAAESIPEPQPAQPEAAPLFEASSDIEPLADADLDALLAGTSATAAAPSPAPVAPPAPVVPPTPAATPNPAPQASSPQSKAAPVQSPAPTPASDAELDALLRAEAAKVTSAVQQEITPPPAPPRPTPPAHSPKPAAAPADPQTQDRLRQCETLLASTTDRLATLEQSGLAARLTNLEQTGLGTSEQLLTKVLEDAQATTNSILTRLPELISNAVGQAIEDFAQKQKELPIPTTLTDTLDILSQQATSVEQRIATLDNAVATLKAQTENTAAWSERLEALSEQGQHFQEQIAALELAVETASSDAPQETASEIEALTTQIKSLAARIDALEQRLDDIQPSFNEKIEKAAASAAARILREEIARMLQG